MFGSLKLPANSIMKVYSHLLPGIGIGAMSKRLIPLEAKGLSVLAMPPGTGWSRFTSKQVLSRLLCFALFVPIIQKRVKLLGLLVIEPGSIRTSPYSCSALDVLIATQDGSLLANSAALLLEVTVSIGISLLAF